MRLIAFDLDGTFLDDDKHIPEDNLAALREAAARGIVIVPATGRIVRGIPERIKALPFVRYYIVSNGAGVYDAEEDRLIHRADIPLKLALRCYAYLDTLPVIYDCYQGDIGYISQWMFDMAPGYFADEPHMMTLMEKLRVRVPDLKDYLREKGEPLQKIQMFFRPQDLNRREEQLRLLPGLFPELTPTTSVSNNIEVNSVHAGKGKALQALCRYLGIALAESLAFGDGTNDIELLQMAGRGVAMANAAAAVKAAADEVTAGNNEAGVAQVIRRILKEQEETACVN